MVHPQVLLIPGRGRVASISLFLPGVNAFPNPSVETNLDDWIFFTKEGLRVPGILDGSWAAQVDVADAPNDYSSAGAARVAASPDDVWSGQIWASGGTPEVYLQFLDAAFGSTGAQGPIAPTGVVIKGYRQYQSLDFLAPADTTSVQMVAYNQSAVAVMLLDAASLIQES